MAWLKVTINQLQSFARPDLCPNCLDSPAGTEVKVSRTFGVPGLASSTTTGSWYFCERCARLFKRRMRWMLFGAVLPAVPLVLFAAAATLIDTGGKSIGRYSGVLLFAALAILVLGAVSVSIAHLITPKPAECLSKAPPVKPIVLKQTFLGKTTGATYSFAHPIYVEQIVAVNPSGAVGVDLAKLGKAIGQYEQKHT